MTSDLNEIGHLAENTTGTTEPPVQFGMRVLLIAPVFVAVLVLLLKYTTVFGVLFAAALTVALHFWRVSEQHRAARQWAVDLLGGIAVPILCLVYDPGLIVPSSSYLSLLAYLAYGFQMLVMAAWLMAGRQLGVGNAMATGVFCVGVGVALVTGTVLLPISIIGLILFGVGALGMFPFFTAYVYGRCARRAIARARETRRPRAVRVLFWAGIGAALLVPVLIYLTCSPILEPWMGPQWKRGLW